MHLTADDLENLERNRIVADRDCVRCNPQTMVAELRDCRTFLRQAQASNAEWKAIYGDGIASRVSGKQVLDLGGGSGKDALILAGHGANVTTVDVSPECAALIDRVARLLGLRERIEIVCADICAVEFPERSFDIILGNRILHHLTHNQEEICLRRTALWLRTNGEARFFENAENNVIVDNLRWLIPMSGRPSSLQHKQFAEYKKINPSHPPRSNSSHHYYASANRFFRRVRIEPVAGLERFHRLFQAGSELELRVKRVALGLEPRLPYAFHLWIARRQAIFCREPR